MLNRKRTVLGGVALLLVFALAAFGLFARGVLSDRAQAVEIGVLFPGASDTNWLDFVAGIELAAGEQGLTVEHRTETYECYVSSTPTPVVFRWYPEVGSRGIRRRVSELCKQPRPPLALVGANNSALTYALAVELAKCPKQRVPLLLMTNATADALIDVNPGRSFRFGYNNGYQAQTVVARLREYYAASGFADPQVRAISVQVLDDPFAIDLAYHFERELATQLQAEFVAPDEPEVAVEGPSLGSGPKFAWSLKTSAGAFDDPSDEEWRLAAKLVDRMARDPNRQWALALPVGTAPYRRFAYALHKSFEDHPDSVAAKKARSGLVILSGDSMNYYTFNRAIVNQLLPSETPAPVIFFAHVDPIDPTVSADRNSRIPAQGLDRQVVRALLRVLPELGPTPTPAALAEALTTYAPQTDGEPLFRDQERYRGGGAIVAIPRTDENRFDLLLPTRWQSTP